MDKASVHEIDPSDQNFIQKTTAIKSLYEINNIIDKNKEEIRSKVFYSFSLIFGVMTAIFAEKLNWIMVLILTNFTLAILIYFARIFYKKRRNFAKEQWKLKIKLKKLGI